MSRELALGTTAQTFVLSIPEELAVPGSSAGTVEIHAPQLDEQTAFKVRALWERDKGRDLFDLWAALTHGGGNPETIASLFKVTDDSHPSVPTGAAA